jgi:mono/diheme cytochrome c family protein
MERRASPIVCTLIGTALAGLLIGCRADGTIGARTKATQGSAPGKPTTPSSSTMTGGGSGTGLGGPTGPVGGNGMPAAPPPAPGLVAGMPADVKALLQTRCSGCHTYGQADPAGWGAALDMSRLTNADIVVPGQPDASRMIDRVAVVGNMPPIGPRLSADEIQLLRDWISNMPKQSAAPPSDEDVLDAIAADQLSIRDRNADYRYVSFSNFKGQQRSAEEMTAAAQSFVFVLNSLSRRGQIVDFPAVDAEGTIFRLRLSDVGWDARVWDTITSFYPYCLRSDAASHQALYVQLGTEAPVVRGDWLMDTLTRPPLYEFLIAQPATLDALAATLGVNINDDINHQGQVTPDNLIRIGFQRSGVALHNRMIERHLGKQGQYLWISYDFNADVGTSDVLANPLGPKLRDRQGFVHDFENAGGEVIYSLPNGLQGYMVVNGVGNHLDAVPIAIARDPHRRDAVVENGLSCYGCHGSPGLLRPRVLDETPRYSDTHIADFLGRELDEIDASYPRQLQPDVLTVDSQRYRAISQSVAGGGPPGGDGAYATFIALTGQYESNLGFHGAASEFQQDYDTFRELVLANDSQDDSLPRTTSAPLISRDDFVCLFRDLVTKIRRNAVFCAKTFDADQVRNLCSGGRRTNGGAGGSSGIGGSSGAGGSSGTGGSSGRQTSADAGAPGMSREPDGGAADGRRDGCRWVRINGRLECR